MSFDLPPTAGPARDAAILRHVRSGDFDVAWSTVSNTIQGHTATFNVFADALKIGGIRISVSAFVLQQIADLMDCSFLTPKLSDLCYLHAQTPIPPFPIQPVSNSTAQMIQESRLIDQNLDSKPAPHGLIAPIGKPFVLCNALVNAHGHSALYGWQTPVAPAPGIPLFSGVTPGVKVVQPLSTAHDVNYVDYAQLCVLVSRACTVDGQPRDLSEVLLSPDLAPLASHEGILKLLRQPGVPAQSPLSPVAAGPFSPVSFVTSSAQAPARGGLVGIALVGGVAGLLAGMAYQG